MISVTSNVIPALFRLLMNENNVELQKKILPFTELLFTEPNPIVLNTVLTMMRFVRARQQTSLPTLRKGKTTKNNHCFRKIKRILS